MTQFLGDKSTEDIITAIEKRPGLYFKGIKEYNSSDVKRKLWSEVCAEVVREWEQLSPQEKTNLITEVQRRWHNLRTCFGRELRNQKTMKSDIAHRRRKYIYFDKLHFLMSSYEPSQAESEINIQPDACINENSSESSSVAATSATAKSKENKFTFEGPALPLSKRTVDIPSMDEDTYFVLSLVPSLRVLSYHDKLEAKMRILDVFRKIRPPPTTSTRKQRPSKAVLRQKVIQDEDITELQPKTDVKDLLTELSEDYSTQE